MSDEHKFDLSRMQRWVQAVVTHVDGVEAGIESSPARSEIDVALNEIESVILPSARRTSIERLEVYGNAYNLRLLECLQNGFPTLARTLGDEVFDQFALEYLQRYPPNSYTLDRLADNFVRHLEETRPDQEAADETPASAASDDAASWPDFLIDLALLEWQIDDVFDAPGDEGQTLLSADQLLAVPPDLWPRACLVPAKSLRLLKFRFPVNQYFTDARTDDDPPLPPAAASFLALTRRDFIVRRHELARHEHALLTHLAAGETVGEAIAFVAESIAEKGDDVEQFSSHLPTWFAKWAADAFFIGIDTDEASPPADAR